jgi:regulatory protein
MAQRWRVTRLPPNRNPSGGKPLDRAALESLALAYLGRFATTRRKLTDYLRRKLRERGWDDATGAPPIETIVGRMAELGYVDDRAFAEARGRALGRRGYGARRIGDALQAAGVAPEDSGDARAAAEASRWESALTFARRRRIGPFASAPLDQDARRRTFAAMIRAGHEPNIVRRIIDATSETEFDE